MGDSHAMALIPGIDEAAKQNSIAGYVATHSNAPPIQGIQHTRKVHSYFDLALLNKNMLSFIDQHTEIKTVLLASRWSSYYHQKKSDMSGDVEQGLINTIEALKRRNIRIVLIGDYPTLNDYYSSQLPFLTLRFPEFYKSVEDSMIPSVPDYERINSKAFAFFSRMEIIYGVEILRQESVFIGDNGGYAITSSGVPLYRCIPFVNIWIPVNCALI